MNSVNNNAVSNSNSNISKKDNRANTLTARLLNKFDQSNIQAKLETVLTPIPLNKPIDAFNHAIDALRYATYNKLSRPNFGRYAIR